MCNLEDSNSSKPEASESRRPGSVTLPERPKRRPTSEVRKFSTISGHDRTWCERVHPNLANLESNTPATTVETKMGQKQLEKGRSTSYCCANHCEIREETGCCAGHNHSDPMHVESSSPDRLMSGTSTEYWDGTLRLSEVQGALLAEGQAVSPQGRHSCSLRKCSSATSGLLGN